jgi:cytoskeletal protein RodZ
MKKVVVLMLVVVAVVAAALLAWIKFNQGVEYGFDLPSAARSSASASVTPAPASERSMSATESIAPAVDAPPAIRH